MSEARGQTLADQLAKGQQRDQQIVRTSMIGIAGNVLLAAFKAVIGLVAGSIAIVLDAVNNLSDALSSLITIIGTKLAQKPADRKHPYGHGRVEYLSAVIISSIVLAAGASSLWESAKAIIHPSAPSYEIPSLAILCVAVVVKIALGRYFVSMGNRLSSDSLVASGTDATMDAVISTATIVAAVIYLTLGISIESWLGLAISLVIVKSGVDILRETLSKILGERVDADLSRSVKQAAESVEGVNGAYDLFLHDYGPNRMEGSLHIEVPDTANAVQIDAICKRVQERVMSECGVILVAVGIYPLNPEDSLAGVLRAEVSRIVWAHDHVRELHGFYVDEEHKSVRFDVVIGFEDRDREATIAAIRSECEEAFPGYQFLIVLDSDISD